MSYMDLTNKINRWPLYETVYLVILTSPINLKTFCVPAQSRSYTSAASPSNSALSIIGKLANREKRRKNVIVYNFPEASDRKADIGSFLNMCKEVYNSDISVNKVVRLGKKFAEKQRSLIVLISLKHDADKSLLLSQSYLLWGN